MRHFQSIFSRHLKRWFVPYRHDTNSGYFYMKTNLLKLCFRLESIEQELKKLSHTKK